MKVLLLISMTITLASIAASGQNVSFKRGATCTNRNVEEISSREIIKIGAKIEDVLNLLAFSEEEKQRLRDSSSDIKKPTVGYVAFTGSPKRNDPRFEGISHYNLRFLDGNLVSFQVGYTKPSWVNAKQFAEKMSEMFNLPAPEYWSDGQTVTSIQCENYRVQIDVSSSPGAVQNSFGVYDNRIEEILKQRARKLEDEQREKDLKAFKP